VSAEAEFADNGWDVRARLVDQQWVERRPRRREIRGRLLSEVSLLTWLAPQLPLEVPRPAVFVEDPLTVRHRLVPGDPCPGVARTQGEQLGAFLAALHSVGVVAAVDHGALAAHEAARDRQRHRNDFAQHVVPRLPAELRREALRLLVRASQATYTPCLTHADIGPDHVRVVDGRITGVIDWIDACVGDPALDLAWALHGASATFAAGVRAAYPVTDEIAERARDCHLLGPWYEVLFGVQEDLPQHVASGLEGAVARLEEAHDGRHRATG
jgi:aminoglycoside phosphotransferase (APT) family kinase protein